MLRQSVGEVDFETGQFAVFTLETERRIGSFQTDNQRTALFDLIQQVFCGEGLRIDTGGERYRHYTQKQLASNFGKHHKYPVFGVIFFDISTLTTRLTS
ncbi:Uncharacterised protein [Serratia odorifera]|uniref:Uncharacterized protein n=1 Tax=Serratia odorifera TaxID=618 RepID=A0A3S4DMQ6_SEROD|nr:Uncharacterised protein [Serratia odorifera]